MTVDSAATFFVSSLLIGFQNALNRLFSIKIITEITIAPKPIKWNVYIPFIPTTEPKIESSANTANTEIQSAGR